MPPKTPPAAGAATALSRPLDGAFDAVAGAWRKVTEEFRRAPQGRALIDFVDARVAAGAVVYPPEPLRVLALTPLESVRVVILGQDPYHGAGQAEGLAFSVPRGVACPPSLRNIFKELARDRQQSLPASGSLLRWAERGVLLLNTTLTVEAGKPASHAGRGWEALTEGLIDAVAARPDPVAFLLWGRHAQSQAQRIQREGRGHGVWRANHPSPLSATRPPLPFIGCGHFGEVERFLERHGRSIDWTL